MSLTDRLTEGHQTASMQALSELYTRKTVHELLWLQNWFNKIMVIYAPLCVAIIVMSCLWADIQGKNTDYTDVSKDWQACLTQADYSYIPLNATLAPAFGQINGIKSSLTTCVLGEYSSGACNLTCLLALQTDCFSKIGVAAPVVPNIALPTGHYLAGLSYVGIQAVIFSAIAHGALHRALRHPSWLVSTIGLIVWFIIAILTYYTVNPVLPVPTSTNSTLFSFLYYGSSYTKYSHLNNGDNECETAFRYVWVYLSFILLLLCTVVAGLAIAVYAEMIRYKSKNKKKYEPLAHTSIPCMLGVVAVIFYLLLISSKMITTVNTLNGINDFKISIKQAGLEKLSIWYPPIWFPFTQATLDIATVLGICCLMSILRGYTVQSVSAFRLAFGCSFVYTVCMYPGICGAVQFYYTNDFTNYDTCWNYFLQSGATAMFGYPNESKAKIFCGAFRLALGASIAIFAMMHFITFACFSTLQENEDRDSMVHEPLDFAIANQPQPFAHAKSESAPPIVPPTAVALDSPVKADSYVDNPLGNNGSVNSVLH